MIAVFCWFAAAGVLADAKFWMFTQAAAYAKMTSVSEGLGWLSINGPALLKEFPALWATSLVGFALLAASGRRVERAGFVWVLLVAGLIALSPGLYFRPHYFLYVLPAAALGFAFAFDRLHAAVHSRQGGALLRVLPALAFCLILFGSLGVRGDYFFRLAPDEVSRRIYGANPFPESAAIARAIKSRTTPQDKVLIFGSEPQILFLSGRGSATGFIYMYPMTEVHPYAEALQRKMIKEVLAASPKVIVNVGVYMSWLETAETVPLLRRWFSHYRANYNRVGLVEISRDGSVYDWAPDVDPEREPRSRFWVEILERSR
jgi:hypothetical protein